MSQQTKDERLGEQRTQCLETESGKEENQEKGGGLKGTLRGTLGRQNDWETPQCIRRGEGVLLDDELAWEFFISPL